MRQIVLDTETTGLEASQGHRIIEIGCVELIDRRRTQNHFHRYLQPDREIDAGAQEVHGITAEFLADKPRFEDVAEAFMDYIRGAELIIHNASFDTGFIRHEFSRLGLPGDTLDSLCTVTDSLALARKMHPAQKNSLDALCKRYQIDNSQRTLHGALLDAEILADVYLAMTGGQRALSLGGQDSGTLDNVAEAVRLIAADAPRPVVITATAAELDAHARCLATIDKASESNCVWLRREEAATSGPH